MRRLACGSSARWRSGVDNIDLAACTARGIAVGHTPGVLADTVADLAVGLLLAAARRIVEGVAYVRDGHWQTWEPELLLGQRPSRLDSRDRRSRRGRSAIATPPRLGSAVGCLATTARPGPSVAAAWRCELVTLRELLAEPRSRRRGHRADGQTPVISSMQMRCGLCDPTRRWSTCPAAVRSISGRSDRCAAHRARSQPRHST